jgi:hypothetical protein
MAPHWDEKYNRFAKLTFDDFRRMAQDESLTHYEKIGYPDSYREGKDQLVLQDILTKLPALSARSKTVLDVGAGCSTLAFLVIDLCRRNNHSLIQVDSAEMLSRLPDEPFVRKIAGYYPYCEGLFEEYLGRIDVVLVYGVVQLIFAESNIWDFLDRSLELMAHGGEMLIGEIPNASKRRRFFSSPDGVTFHREFMRTHTPPEVIFNRIERHAIDDSVILSLVARARSQGFDAYVLPQNRDLPMANRREDIVIRRP